MDREGIVTAAAPERQRGIVRRSLERVLGSAIVIGGAALKWGFLFAKFFAFFVSFALYSTLFGSWEFGLGLVLLILVHELGHFAEAKRQHLQVSLPTFVPLLGAFVTIRRANLAPWGSALVSLAGPFVGSVGAAAVWAASSARDSSLLLGLANIGFLLNAFNLLPIGFLDGGSVARAFSEERRGWIRYENGVPVEATPPDGRRALLIGSLYALLAAAIVLGLLATKRNGTL
ncbi:MAG TPA: site-2 protease family protein [Gaiellaceae bacterium]|nr:site-2 protease family protein [Gaiellaceae bacterium]